VLVSLCRAWPSSRLPAIYGKDPICAGDERSSGGL